MRLENYRLVFRPKTGDRKGLQQNFMLRGLNAFDSTQNIGRVLIRNMGEEWLKGCLKIFELVFYYSKAHPFNPFNRE